jgi:hypothetical protein
MGLESTHPANVSSHDQTGGMANEDEGDELQRLRDTVESMGRRIAELEDRQSKTMALLNSPSPEKIDHDLRNVINELVLLRKVLEQEEGA